MTGTVVLLSSIPFWFLPKSLPKQGEEQSQSKATELATVTEQENFLPDENQEHEEKEKPVTFQELAKGTVQAFASVRNTTESCEGDVDRSSHITQGILMCDFILCCTTLSMNSRAMHALKYCYDF